MKPIFIHHTPPHMHGMMGIHPGIIFPYPEANSSLFQHVRKIEQQLMAWEGLLDAGQEFAFHVGGDSDDSSDDSPNSCGGVEEGQACGDHISTWTLINLLIFIKIQKVL
jgi:hypothetical protein